MLGDGIDVFHLLRCHTGQKPDVVEGSDHGPVGEFVEGLHLLAMHIGAPRKPHHLGKSRLVDLAADELGSGGDLFEQGSESARDTGEAALLFD